MTVLACLVAALAVAAPARAAVTIGPDPLPERSSVIGSANARIFATGDLPGVGVTSPIDGVVVLWRVRRGSGPGALPEDTITLRILRGTATENEFTAVGTSESHEVPSGAADPEPIHEYPTRLPIAAGDRIGLGTMSNAFPAREEAGASYLTRKNALADGESGLFEVGAFENRYVLINADIEPDCDGDGFGDETQDPQIPQTDACGFLAEMPPVPVPAPESPPDTTAPVGFKLRFHPRRFRPARKKAASIAQTSASKGRKRAPRTSLVTYRLSEVARVRFVVKRWRFGRLKGKRCVFGKQARQLHDAKRCKKLLRVKGQFAHAGKPGSNRFRFRGKVGGKPLRPGRYRMVGVPIDVAGNRGKSFRQSFAIAR